MVDVHVRRHRLELWLDSIRSQTARSANADELSSDAVADLIWMLNYIPKGRGKRVTVGSVSVTEKSVAEAGLRCRHWMRLHRDRVNMLCDMGLEYVPADLQLHPEGYMMMTTGDRTEEITQDGIPLTALMVEALCFYGEAKVDGDMLVFADEA